MQTQLGICAYHNKKYPGPKGDGRTGEAKSDSGKSGALKDKPPVVPNVMFLCEAGGFSG